MSKRDKSNRTHNDNTINAASDVNEHVHTVSPNHDNASLIHVVEKGAEIDRRCRIEQCHDNDSNSDKPRYDGSNTSFDHRCRIKRSRRRNSASKHSNPHAHVKGCYDCATRCSCTHCSRSCVDKKIARMKAFLQTRRQGSADSLVTLGIRWLSSDELTTRHRLRQANSRVRYRTCAVCDSFTGKVYKKRQSTNGSSKPREGDPTGRNTGHGRSHRVQMATCCVGLLHGWRYRLPRLSRKRITFIKILQGSSDVRIDQPQRAIGNATSWDIERRRRARYHRPRISYLRCRYGCHYQRVERQGKWKVKTNQNLTHSATGGAAQGHDPSLRNLTYNLNSDCDAGVIYNSIRHEHVAIRSSMLDSLGTDGVWIDGSVVTAWAWNTNKLVNSLYGKTDLQKLEILPSRWIESIRCTRNGKLQFTRKADNNTRWIAPALMNGHWLWFDINFRNRCLQLHVDKDTIANPFSYTMSVAKDVTSKVRNVVTRAMESPTPTSGAKWMTTITDSIPNLGKGNCGIAMMNDIAKNIACAQHDRTSLKELISSSLTTTSERRPRVKHTQGGYYVHAHSGEYWKVDARAKVQGELSPQQLSLWSAWMADRYNRQLLGPEFTNQWSGGQQSLYAQLPLGTTEVTAIFQTARDHWVIANLKVDGSWKLRLWLYRASAEEANWSVLRKQIQRLRQTLVRDNGTQWEFPIPNRISSSTTVIALEDHSKCTLRIATDIEARMRADSIDITDRLEGDALLQKFAYHYRESLENGNAQVSAWRLPALSWYLNQPSSAHEVKKPRRVDPAHVSMDRYAMQLSKHLFGEDNGQAFMERSGPHHDRYYHGECGRCDSAEAFFHCDGKVFTYNCQRCGLEGWECGQYGEWRQATLEMQKQRSRELWRQRFETKIAQLDDDKPCPLSSDQYEEYEKRANKRWHAQRDRPHIHWSGNNAESYKHRTNRLNAATLNVAGGLNKRWFDMIEYMHSRHVHIMCLQHTGLNAKQATTSGGRLGKQANTWHPKAHMYKAFNAPGVLNKGKTSKGVTIIMRDWLADMRRDVESSPTTMSIRLIGPTGKDTIISTFYGTTAPLGSLETARQNVTNLHSGITKASRKKPSFTRILTGDFNCTHDPLIDRQRSKATVEANASNMVTERELYNDITRSDDSELYVDAFRQLHPKLTAFSRIVSKGSSRIDYVTHTGAAVALAAGIEHDSGFSSDHHPVVVSYDMESVIDMRKAPHKGAKTECRLRFSHPPRRAQCIAKEYIVKRSKRDTLTDAQINARTTASGWTGLTAPVSMDECMEISPNTTRDDWLPKELRNNIWDLYKSEVQSLCDSKGMSLTTEARQLLDKMLDKLRLDHNHVRAEVDNDIVEADIQQRIKSTTTFAEVAEIIQLACGNLDGKVGPYFKVMKPPGRSRYSTYLSKHKRETRLREIESRLTSIKAELDTSKASFNRIRTLSRKLNLPTHPSTTDSCEEFEEWAIQSKQARVAITNENKIACKRAAQRSARTNRRKRRRKVFRPQHRSEISSVLKSLLQVKPAPEHPSIALTRDANGEITGVSHAYDDIRAAREHLFFHWTASPTLRLFPETKHKPFMHRYTKGFFPSPPKKGPDYIEAIMNERLPVGDRYIHLMDVPSDTEWAHVWKVLSPKMFTSPGPSGISFALLNETPSEIKDTIRALVNDIFTTQIIPEQCRNAVLVGIPKGDGSDPDEVRPISMVECLQKLVSNVLAMRLNKIIYETRNDLFPLIQESQFGFRKGRGTSIPILTLQLMIEEAVELKKPFHGLSCDMRKAFDYVEPHSLQRCYERMNLPLEFRRLMAEMSYGAATRVDTEGGLTNEIPIQRGTRQGEPLSPFQWLCFIDPLLELLKRHGGGFTTEALGKTAGSMAYADDTFLAADSSDELKEMFDICLDYMLYNEAMYNPKKTLYSCVNASPVPPVVRTPSWSGVAEEPAKVLAANEAFRYLGVFFALDGSWTDQCNVVDAALDRMYTALKYTLQSATETETRLVLGSSVLRKLAYPLQFAAIPRRQMLQWERKIRSLFRIGMRLPKGINLGLLYAPKSVGGLECPSLEATLAEERIATTLGALRTPKPTSGCWTAELLRHSCLRLQKRRNVTVSPWQAPHAHYENETPTWASNVAEALYLTRRAIWPGTKDSGWWPSSDAPPEWGRTPLAAVLPNFHLWGNILKAYRRNNGESFHYISDIVDPASHTFRSWNEAGGYGLEPQWYKEIKQQLSDTDEEPAAALLPEVPDWAPSPGTFVITRTDNRLWRTLEHWQQSRIPCRAWGRIEDSEGRPQFRETNITKLIPSRDLAAISETLQPIPTQTKPNLTQLAESTSFWEQPLVVLNRKDQLETIVSADRYNSIERTMQDSTGTWHSVSRTQLSWLARLRATSAPATDSDRSYTTAPHALTWFYDNLHTVTFPLGTNVNQWTDAMFDSRVPWTANTMPWSQHMPNTDIDQLDKQWLYPTELEAETTLKATIDGSFYPDTKQTGYAILFHDNDDKLLYTTGCQINSDENSAPLSEIAAVLHTLRIHPEKKLTIRSDCQTALDRLRHRWDFTPNELLRMPFNGLHSQLMALLDGRELCCDAEQPITTEKVAAHLRPGQTGYCKLNEEADLAAKLIAKGEAEDIEVAPTLYNHDLGVGDGAYSLVRQGPFPGSVHTLVLGDIRADIRRQFQQSAIEEWASHPSQGSRWNSSIYDTHSTSSVLKRLTGGFHAKALTKNIPTIEVLIRNFHSHRGVALRKANCLLCHQQKETQSHLLECFENNGIDRMRARQADIISQFEPLVIDDDHLEVWKNNFKSYVKDLQWLQPTGTAEKMQNLRPCVEIGSKLFHLEWFMEAWEIARLHNKRTHAFVAQCGAAKPTERWPHSLTRSLQSTLNFTQHIATTWEEWYPGVHKHGTIATEAWTKSLVNECTFITTPPHTEVVDSENLLSDIVNLWKDMDKSSATRIVLLIPEAAIDQGLVENGGRILCRFERLPYHSAADMTARKAPRLDYSEAPWCIAVWETDTIANNFPIVEQLRKDVEGWLSRNGHTVKGTDSVIWNAATQGNKLPEFDWSQKLPSTWDSKPTPWRLAPYFQLPWLGGTGVTRPLCPFGTIHSSEIKAELHHGLVPHTLTNDILKRIGTDTPRNRQTATQFAIKLAHAAASTTRHWIWKERNTKHHEAIEKNDQLRWLSNRQRTPPPEDFDVNVNDTEPQKPATTSTNRDTRFFRPSPDVPTVLHNESARVSLMKRQIFTTRPPDPP